MHFHDYTVERLIVSGGIQGHDHFKTTQMKESLPTLEPTSVR